MTAEERGIGALEERGSLHAIFAVVLVELLGFGVVLPLLPIYARELTQSELLLRTGIPVGLAVGVIVASFSGVQVLSAPIWGRLSDRWGRRPILLIGLAGSCLCYVLLALAALRESWVLLLASRVGAGAAAATVVTAYAYIADRTPEAARTGGMTIIGSAFGLGFTVGPLLAAVAVPRHGGHPGAIPGYLAAALSALAFLFASWRIEESLDPTRRRARGSAPREDASPAAPVSSSLRTLIAASFVCALAFASFEATLALLVSDRSRGFGFGFREVCATFAALGLLSASVQGGVVRRVASRVSELPLVVAGCLLEMGGFAVLAIATARDSLPLLVGGLLGLVVGFAFLTPSLNSLISLRGEASRQGGTMGATQGASALARVLGPLLGIPLLLHTGAAAPLWFGCALLALGLALFWIGARAGGRPA